MSIDDQRYAALTLESLRVTIGPLQASTTSLESQESYLTAGMLPYNRNVTLQTFLSSTRDFYRLHSTFARLYNAAASPASRLRSAGSLAIMKKDISANLQQKRLIFGSKILLKVQHNMSLKVLLPWQQTWFQTSPILKAFLATYNVLFSYLQIVPRMYDPADI